MPPRRRRSASGARIRQNCRRTSRMAVSMNTGPMIVASLMLNWVIPFFVLLPRESKRNETIMLRIAAVVLIGRWIDLSVMIYPPVIGDAPALGLPEVAGVTAGLGLAISLFVRAFRKADPVPRRDPYLDESLHYAN